jgi:hypothetical protein
VLYAGRWRLEADVDWLGLDPCIGMGPDDNRNRLEQHGLEACTKAGVRIDTGLLLSYSDTCTVQAELCWQSYVGICAGQIGADVLLLWLQQHTCCVRMHVLEQTAASCYQPAHV